MPETTIQTPFALTAGVHSIAGKRDSYEDRVLLSPELRLFAVADGLGGHLDGDVAAQTCVDILFSEIEQSGEPSVHAMRNAVELAHRAVRALDVCRVTKTPQHKLSCYCRPPGTTLTALWFKPRSVIVAHIGDCRVYHWTHPESECRVITQEHRSRGGLSKHVGRYYGELEPDIFELAVEPGHALLVCSDGLWEPLEKLGATVRASDLEAPMEGSRNLVSLVEASSDDNISALLIAIGPAK